MIKSTNQTKKTKIVSKIIIISLNESTYIKVLQRGDKAVVRQGGEIIFNNLKNKNNFNDWWEKNIDSLSDKIDINVKKSEIVDNDAMIKIHEKYK